MSILRQMQRDAAEIRAGLRQDAPTETTANQLRRHSDRRMTSAYLLALLMPLLLWAALVVALI